jgi:CDP-glycerol glycerophosphotransferase (TagB/SpsB family)
VVVVSFNWNNDLTPETSTAFPHFRRAVKELANSKEIQLVGHSHPRGRHDLQYFYERMNVRFIQDFDDVMDEADLYVVDNSSTLYEFAATGKPVVALNAPWYRRDVHHGLRFWECVDVGINCSDPSTLPWAINSALVDPVLVRERREEIVATVTPHRGRATDLAVSALLNLRE